MARTIHFFEPDDITGGLEAAINGLRDALRHEGLIVTEGGEIDGIAHFHGLWQREHSRLSRSCRARGIPYVVSPHGMLEPWAWKHKWWKKWPYFQLVEHRHLAGAACVLATSESEAANLRRFLPGSEIRALPLGLTGSAKPDYLEARRKLGWNHDELILLFLSRIHPKKGLDLLLNALAEIPPGRHRLVIVGGGDPDYLVELQRLSAGQPEVEWVGEIWGEERWKFFQGADLFCLPSHSENFGLAILEACQVGTPVLTTPATPWGDWLDHDLICQPTVAGVRAAVQHFLSFGKSTDEERKALAERTWRKFHWDALAPAYVAMYESLKHQGNARRA